MIASLDPPYPNTPLPPSFSLDLQVTAYRLGQVYFKILKNSTSTNSAVKLVKGDAVDQAAVQSSVDYRLVPDTRDLIGARMLLTMSAKDGEEVRGRAVWGDGVGGFGESYASRQL